MTTNTETIPRPDLTSPTSWTDTDYHNFVHHYAAGAYPEIQADPTAWDHHFILANDPDAPFRPTLISSADFHASLPPCHRNSYGLLVLKLWEIARAKGCTARLEEQHRRAQLARQQHEEELRQAQLRGEIEALRPNLPDPEPNPPVNPRQQWYAAIMAAILPDSTLLEKVRHLQKTVIHGQPFRNALLQESAAAVLNSTFGPLMLTESADAISEPFPTTDNELDPEPILKKWAPDATPGQIINGAARDLSDLVCMLIARQRVAVGYEADKESVTQALKLTRALRDLNHVSTTTALTEKRKRGRPPKAFLPRQ